MPPLFPEKVESIRHLSTKSWEATFTKDYLSNEGQLRFLSRMCYLAMAHYLLYRGVLAKGVFKRRKLEAIFSFLFGAIYCFDGNTRWGRKLSEMMKGIREAIDQKYIKQAFVMINEDKEDPDVVTEVFSVGFCYNEQHTMTVLDDKGNRIVSFGYKGEKVFRMQVKHIIKKLSVVTKNLEPLKKGAVPYLKLIITRVNTPDDYEPSICKHCENTYTFNKSNPPTFYKFGDISNKETAMSFVLESVYIKGADVSTLDDLLFDQAGYKDNDEQQTTVGTTPEQTTHSSEHVEKARQDKDDFLMESFDSPTFKLVADESDESGDYVQINKKTRESPYVKGRPKRYRLNSPRLELSRFVPKSSLKSSVSHRSVLELEFEETTNRINRRHLWHRGYKFVKRKCNWFSCCQNTCQATVRLDDEQHLTGRLGSKEHNHCAVFAQQSADAGRAQIKRAIEERFDIGTSATHVRRAFALTTERAPLAGYKDNDEVNMLDVTADGFFASEEVQQTTVGTTPEQTTHSSEHVEKARQDKDDFLMESFDSPAFKLVADESDESGDYVQINKKTRESPYVKGRPKRSRLNSPRLELSRFVPKSSLKSSVSHRSVLKSPNANDNGPYVNSPITLN
ncbi:hypothetical protein niasHT_004863 [Heterodera trifolii]|uniref:HORMA domain-containing protein n=1 Tax=Heterodera trifolii TaxID=157864 RepID=A0ABD2LTV7_9BILA